MKYVLYLEKRENIKVHIEEIYYREEIYTEKRYIT